MIVAGTTAHTTTEAVPRTYYDASVVPILTDTNSASTGSPLNVRVVSLTSAGAIATKFVQERGVLEFATQKRNSSNQLLWFDASGLETTTNTGIPVLLAATSATGSQVYLDSSFNKVLVNTGHLSYVTDFFNPASVALYIDAGGYRTATVVTRRPSLT